MALQAKEAMRILNRAGKSRDQFESTIRSVRVTLAFFTLTTFICAWIVLSGSCPAQLPQLFGLTTPTETNDTQDQLPRLYSERRIVKQLEDLSAAVRNKQVREIRDLLQALRLADPLLMVPAAKGTFVPLHRDLALRVQNFPPEFVQEFRQENIPAEAALRQSLGKNSYPGLITFLHRYAGTPASLKAHLLLATVHADRGHPMAAEFWLVPLLTDKADPELKALAEILKTRIAAASKPSESSASLPSQTGQPGPMPATPGFRDEASRDGTSGDAESQLPATSATEEGDLQSAESGPQSVDGSEGAAQNDNQIASSEDEEPFLHYVHWMQSLPLSSSLRRRSQDLVQGAPELGLLPWSAWEPQVDDQQIYIRTPQLISAYSRRNGKHVWTRTIQQQEETSDYPDDSTPIFRLPMDPNAVNAALNSPDIQLVHRNEIVGRMTSDSERLYAVCQIGEATPTTTQQGNINIRLRIIAGRGAPVTAGLWELIGVEKSSGRRLWTTGGAPVEEKFGNELAMAWFAGPPTVSGQELYQVIERNDSVQLACLRASTGQVRWTLPLTFPDQQISQDPARQLLAAQTHVEAGVIFTTTTTGWVFAVDALTHSVFWARPLPPIPGEAARSRIRNSAFLQTPLQPLGKTWRSRPPILSSNALVIACAESPQLVVLDPRDGRIRLRVSELAGKRIGASVLNPRTEAAEELATVILYADKTMFVVSSPKSTAAWRLPDLKKLWTVPRKSAHTVPVGPGIRSGDHLIIPLSDGSLEAITLADGLVRANLKGLRPPFGSGGLFSSGDEVVSYGPDHVAILSSQAGAWPEDTDPLQQAMFMADTGQLDEALETLSHVNPHPLNVETIQRLRFRIAVRFFVTDPVPAATRLEEIAALAETPAERALSQYLRLNFLLSSSPETVVAPLISSLEEDDLVQNVEIPHSATLREHLLTSTSQDPLTLSSLTSGANTRRHPFHAWVLQQLRRQVATADQDRLAEIVLSLAQLSDGDVLELHSERLVGEYLRRAEQHLANENLSEAVLQLLIAASDLSGGAGPGIDVIPSAFADRIATAMDTALKLSEETSVGDTAYKALVRRLLEVVRYEHRVSNGEPAGTPENLQDVLASRWESSSEKTLKMLPVSTTGQMSYRTPAVADIDTSPADDLFLSAFQWSLRRSPGALMARSLQDPALPAWVLKTSSSEGTFTLSEEELFRFGSVLVFRNPAGVSAFSVTEQRWLWTRNMPGGTMRLPISVLNRPFQDFDVRVSPQLMTGLGSRICGGGARWMCMVFDGTLEVVDVLTGNRLWSVNGINSSSTVFASEAAIWVSGLESNPVALSPFDGAKISTGVMNGAFNILRRTMRATNDALVVWNPGSGGSRKRAVEWIDPVSAEVLRRVELPEMEWAQFLGSESLAAVTGDQRCHVVNLRTGEHTTFNFAGEGDLELMPQQIAVASDAVNYYIFERRANAILMFSTLYGIRAEPILKELRAINRRTGKLAWIRPVEESTFACIDGTESVMLILTVSGKQRGNAVALPGLQIQQGQRYVIDGVSRTTGKQMLNYTVVAQIPFPSLRLSADGAGQLDLEAFGNRVRFLPDADTPAE